MTSLKIILRTIFRNKVYSGINILGLAVGVAAVMLIYRIVHYELGFNKNFSHYDRIARVVLHESGPEGESWSSCVPIPAMAAIQETVTQFETFAKVREVWPTVVVPNPAGGAPIAKFATTTGRISYFTEPSFFKIFNMQWLAGDPETALLDAGSVVLTRSMADKCFGAWQQALDQTLLIDNLVAISVRGVVADLPADCDLPIEMLISYPTLIANGHLFFYSGQDEWGSCSSNNQAYALLKAPSQWEAASAVLAKVGEQEYGESNRYKNSKKVHRLQPLSELHYDENLGTPYGHTMTKSRLRVLSLIGLLVLVMACFNFINLATAQATQRAKEVGVRKTLGGSRQQLVRRFMAETAVLTLISVTAGLFLAQVCLPLLQYVSQVPPEAPFLSLPITWAFLIFTAMSVTLLAGFYPAMILAGFNPVEALKNQIAGRGSSRATVRKGLVVLQFSIAVALVIGAMVTLGQLDYIQKKDLGFNKNLVYTFYFNNDTASLLQLSALKQQLLQIPAVEHLSFCSDHPSSGNTWDTNFAFPASAEDAPFNLSLKFADADYQQTYGLRLVAGQWFSPGDTLRDVVVNQMLLKRLNISDPEEVIGKELRMGGRRRVTISGVVEDFHAHSVHRPVQPLLIGARKEFYYNAGLKIRPDNLPATVAAIQKTFDEVYPEQVFAGQWFDESLAQFYEDENRFSNTCKGFGLLAVFIACLGLFGLAMFTAEQRTKEIGIRKVLGASVAGITGLLAKDFLKLVIIAIVIASPVAYWAMSRWLADFAYSIDLQWWMFVPAGAAAIVIAFLTVSFQSIRAALANPVESLRSE
ncbi:MAG: ABC transporter permease [Saprospiraceae bacterium]|nr:ABC transporter permease [Saprospiraceae bacterium]